MSSQIDLDQGGTTRQFERRWLGPSVGWVWTPVLNRLDVTAAGTASPVNGTTLIVVNINGAVTIQLWDPSAPNPPANSLPGPFLVLPLTIVDSGGFAAAHPITILPAAGKTIIGLSSIQITAAYGVVALSPNLATGNWTQYQ